MANSDEKRIQFGKYEDGVLEIREGFKKLDGESMEGYEHVRKVIFPSSLEKLDECMFSETKWLEELDFSRVTKLKKIPEALIDCETKITTFVIPQGVKDVGAGFIGTVKAGTKVFVPSSVKSIGYINGNGENELDVYLFASGIDLNEVEADIRTLYVLPNNYPEYAEKLKDCESEAKLREIPEELLNFYSTSESTASIVQTAPTAPAANIASQNISLQQITNTKNLANNLIPQELNQLIQQYLTDGVLTDKERQVILKKAEGMGLDRDEIDLYLDAEVQKIDLATDAVVRKKKGKTCPYCGAPIPQLADKCPECGQFITPEASEELREILDNLEEALVDLKSGKDIKKNKAEIERYARKAKMYYGSNPKIQKLLEEIEIETDLINKKVKKEESTEKRNNNINNLGCTISFLCFAVPLVLLFYYDGNLPNNVTAVWFVGILGGWFFIYRKFTSK